MSFEAALQQSVYDRLSAYPGMPTVYDDVPGDAAYPYVTIGEDTHIPFDTDDSLGSESTLTLHTWSRYRGKKECKEIMALNYAALTRQPLVLDGYDLITLEFEYSEVVLDPDGITRHGVQRFRALVEQATAT
jgi:hypothetical protein